MRFCKIVGGTSYVVSHKIFPDSDKNLIFFPDSKSKIGVTHVLQTNRKTSNVEKNKGVNFTENSPIAFLRSLRISKFKLTFPHFSFDFCIESFHSSKNSSILGTFLNGSSFTFSSIVKNYLFENDDIYTNKINLFRL